MKIIKIQHTNDKLLNLDKFKIFLETKYIINYCAFIVEEIFVESFIRYKRACLILF